MKARFVVFLSLIIMTATVAVGCNPNGSVSADSHAMIDQLIEDGIAGAKGAKIVGWSDSMPVKQLRAGFEGEGEATEEVNELIDSFGKGAVVAEVDNDEFGKVQFLGYEEVPDEELFGDFSEDELNHPMVAFFEEDGEVQDEEYEEIMEEHEDNPFLE